MYTQIMIFVREKDGLGTIMDYLNMRGLAKGIRGWERFAQSPRWLQALGIAPVLAMGLRPRTLRLAWSCARLFLANLFQIHISKYPAKLLPVVLNTNCTAPSADQAVSLQCMSGILYFQEGDLVQSFSTRTLLKNEKAMRGTSPAAEDE